MISNLILPCLKKFAGTFYNFFIFYFKTKICSYCEIKFVLNFCSKKWPAKHFTKRLKFFYKNNNEQSLKIDKNVLFKNRTNLDIKNIFTINKFLVEINTNYPIRFIFKSVLTNVFFKFFFFKFKVKDVNLKLGAYKNNILFRFLNRGNFVYFVLFFKKKSTLDFFKGVKNFKLNSLDNFIFFFNQKETGRIIECFQKKDNLFSEIFYMDLKNLYKNYIYQRYAILHIVWYFETMLLKSKISFKKLFIYFFIKMCSFKSQINILIFRCVLKLICLKFNIKFLQLLGYFFYFCLASWKKINLIKSLILFDCFFRFFLSFIRIFCINNFAFFLLLFRVLTIVCYFSYFNFFYFYRYLSLSKIKYLKTKLRPISCNKCYSFFLEFFFREIYWYFRLKKINVCSNFFFIINMLKHDCNFKIQNFFYLVFEKIQKKKNVKSVSSAVFFCLIHLISSKITKIKNFLYLVYRNFSSSFSLCYLFFLINNCIFLCLKKYKKYPSFFSLNIFFEKDYKFLIEFVKKIHISVFVKKKFFLKIDKNELFFINLNNCNTQGPNRVYVIQAVFLSMTRNRCLEKKIFIIKKDLLKSTIIKNLFSFTFIQILKILSIKKWQKKRFYVKFILACYSSFYNNIFHLKYFFFYFRLYAKSSSIENTNVFLMLLIFFNLNRFSDKKIAKKKVFFLQNKTIEDFWKNNKILKFKYETPLNINHNNLIQKKIFDIGFLNQIKKNKIFYKILLIKKKALCNNTVAKDFLNLFIFIFLFEKNFIKKPLLLLFATSFLKFFKKKNYFTFEIKEFFLNTILFIKNIECKKTQTIMLLKISITFKEWIVIFTILSLKLTLHLFYKNKKTNICKGKNTFFKKTIDVSEVSFIKTATWFKKFLSTIDVVLLQ